LNRGEWWDGTGGPPDHVYRQALDAIEQDFAGLQIIVTHGQLKVRPVGNNIVLGAGVKGTHGNHTSLSRRQGTDAGRYQILVFSINFLNVTAL
jgi:hypothetical protein